MATIVPIAVAFQLSHVVEMKPGISPASVTVPVAVAVQSSVHVVLLVAP